jgi:hypothetical protein
MNEAIQPALIAQLKASGNRALLLVKRHARHRPICKRNRNRHQDILST